MAHARRVRGHPRATHAESYNATIAVVAAVRKAKADANASMAAPVAKVSILAEAATLEALKPLLGDIERMLKIEATKLKEGAPEDGLAEVQTEVAQD